MFISIAVASPFDVPSPDVFLRSRENMLSTFSRSLIFLSSPKPSLRAFCAAAAN
jgi:hypothetical protein